MADTWFGFDPHVSPKVNVRDPPPALESRVRHHLCKVYGTVLAASLVAVAGAYAHMWGLFIFGGGFLSFLVGLASLVGIYVYPDTAENRLLRFGLLFNFAFMEGLSLGPLIEYSSAYGNLLLQACLVTAGIFASFSGAALTAKNSYMWIYLGGILGTTLSVLTWLALFNTFFGFVEWLFTWELYVGLAMMCGYIVYDTQLIVHRVNLGSEDVVGHTVDLFVDLVDVFARVLVIMLKSENNRERGNSRSRRSEYAG